MTDLVKRPTLAEYAMEVERMCSVVEACEGEISDDVLVRFAETTSDLAAKVDNWIGFLDATKSRVELLKEHKERVTKAVKAADGFQSRLKGYVKHVMQAFPDVPYRGSTGALYLHKNPEGVKVDFETKEVTFYKQIDRELVNLEPSLNPYIKEIKIYVLETDKIKADLKAGMQLPWARLEQDSHIRTKA